MEDPTNFVTGGLSATRAAQQAALRAASENANRLNLVEAVSQMANNPELAKAAGLAATMRRKQFTPEKMGTQGFMLPDSGEFVESPMHVDEKNAARDAKMEALAQTLQARSDQAGLERTRRREALEAQLADRARHDNMMAGLRMTVAGMTAGRRNDKEDAALEKRLEKEERDVDAGVQKLAAFADKKQLTRLMANARKLDEKLATASEESGLPGFETTDMLKTEVPFGGRFLSSQAIENISTYKGIVNALTRADAGLSQTQGEVLRQVKETFDRPTASARERTIALRTQLLPLIDEIRASTLGSGNDRVRKKYEDNQKATGGDAVWMQPLRAKAASKTTDADDALINKYLPKKK